mgnify:CR=1 FL=1
MCTTSAEHRCTVIALLASTLRQMLPRTIDLRSVAMPTGSDEEMAFQTFRSYLEAVCLWTNALYPNQGGVLAGVAEATKAGSWRGRTTARSRILTNRAAEVLRNGWATEVLLNSPRVLGGAELVAFANLWAPVQAYYAVFNGFSGMAMTLTASRPPKTHATLLAWAAAQVGHPASPFLVPWTEAEQIVESLREKGIPHEYLLYEDEGHGFAKPENRLHFYAAAEKFLANHLGGACEESPGSPALS